MSKDQAILESLDAGALKGVRPEKAQAALGQVPRLFEDLSPPRPSADPLARALRRPPVRRERGAGRPTKQERRRIDAFLREPSGDDD